MHLAIVDDLEMDQKALQQQLSSYLDSHHIAYRLSLFSDGENFLAAYRPKQFDGVFLDNGMDRLSGMETARRLLLSVPVSGSRSFKIGRAHV